MPTHTEGINNQFNEIGGKNTRHKRSYGNGIETDVLNISNYPIMEPARIFRERPKARDYSHRGHGVRREIMNSEKCLAMYKKIRE